MFKEIVKLHFCLILLLKQKVYFFKRFFSTQLLVVFCILKKDQIILSMELILFELFFKV